MDLHRRRQRQGSFPDTILNRTEPGISAGFLQTNYARRDAVSYLSSAIESYELHAGTTEDHSIQRCTSKSCDDLPRHWRGFPSMRRLNVSDSQFPLPVCG